ELDGLRVRIEPFFEKALYPSGDDPIAHFLLELEVRRTKPVAEPKNEVKADLCLVLDVSGSMEAADRYPLLRRAVDELLSRRGPEDRVAFVVFSTRADVVTELISGSQARDDAKDLLARMDRSGIMFAGGTNLAPGIQQAINGLRKAHVRTDAVRRI